MTEGGVVEALMIFCVNLSIMSFFIQRKMAEGKLFLNLKDVNKSVE